MRRFERFLPLVIIIAMTVVYLCEVLILRLAEFQQTELVLLLVVNVIVTLVLLARAKVLTAKNLDNIRALNESAENSLNATLDTMPIGVLRYSESDYTPEWFNPYVDIIFTNDEENYKPIKSKKSCKTLMIKGCSIYLLDRKSMRLKLTIKRNYSIL